jgi:hydrogenase expression/formation protein HypD
MPSTALSVMQAEKEGIDNFYLFCNHITIIPTIKAVLVKITFSFSAIRIQLSITERGKTQTGQPGP